MHVLFSERSEAPAAKACPLGMADEIQHRIGGSFQAAIERFASDREEAELDEEDGTETGSESAREAVDVY